MFKDNLLKNKTIVVTGGGSGLGKSMARRFGELGANLVISGRRKEVLEEAAHEFSEKNIDVLTCPGDVRKIEDVETMSKLIVFNNWESTVSFIENKVKPKYNSWNENKILEKRFLDILKKRFDV